MKLIRAILIGILLVTTGNMWAGDTSYYAKVNVSAESGKERYMHRLRARLPLMTPIRNQCRFPIKRQVSL